jgi:hypothetical protein
LPSSIGTDRDSILGHGLGTTPYPAQGIEEFVEGTIADRFLPALHLFPQRGKETVPPHILS